MINNSKQAKSNDNVISFPVSQSNYRSNKQSTQPKPTSNSYFNKNANNGESYKRKSYEAVDSSFRGNASTFQSNNQSQPVATRSTFATSGLDSAGYSNFGALNAASSQQKESYQSNMHISYLDIQPAHKKHRNSNQHLQPPYCKTNYFD